MPVRSMAALQAGHIGACKGQGSEPITMLRYSVSDGFLFYALMLRTDSTILAYLPFLGHWQFCIGHLWIVSSLGKRITFGLRPTVSESGVTKSVRSCIVCQGMFVQRETGNLARSDSSKAA